MNKKFYNTIIILMIFLFWVNINVLRSILSYDKNPIFLLDQPQSYLKKSNTSNNFTFKVGQFGDPYTLELVDAWDSSSNDVIEQVVETLFSYDLFDLDLPRINLLAQSYWWENLTTLHIQLRQGILFHDGMPFNASAAKWNLDRLLYLTNCTGTNMGQVASTRSLWILPNSATPIIASIDVVGNWNITITLNGPFTPLLDLLSFINAGMVSPLSTPATEFIDLETGQLVGTGPFIYKGYIPQVEVRFSRNNRYWREPAYFEEMVFIYFFDIAGLNNAMLNHEIDYLRWSSASSIPTFEADPLIKVKRFTDETDKPGLTYQGIGFNNKLYNVTWRKAMSYAINYSYILEEMLIANGISYAQRANSPISPGYGSTYNESIQAATYNLTIARAVMQSMGFGVGFTTDVEWIAVAEGSSPFLTINYTYNERIFEDDLFHALNNWYKLIGIKVIGNVLNWIDFYTYLLHKPDYLSLFPMGWIPDYLEPFNILDPLFNPESDFNFAGVNDMWLNARMAEALITTNDIARANIYKMIQWYMAEIGYFHIYLYHPRYYFVHLAELQGISYNAKGSFYAYPIHRLIPGQFSLTSDAGDPDEDGTFTLNWTSSSRAYNYSVYQHSSYISDIDGNITLLASEITDLSLALSDYPGGFYYFIVVAHNEYGNTLSNCIKITIPFDHDLEVLMEIPSLIKIDTNYIINATVKNIGLNDEINVKLFLYCDEIQVDSILITALPVGESVILHYEWSPTEYKAYNFTAYAPPVVNESYQENNRKTTIGYLIPGDFTLSSNAEVPDDDGKFSLTWMASTGANNYSIYQYSSYITEINDNLTLIADNITNLALALSNYSDGTYYFIVVAQNDAGDTISNCISVTVLRGGNPEIPGYNIVLIAATLGVAIVLVIKKKHNIK